MAAFQFRFMALAIGVIDKHGPSNRLAGIMLQIFIIILFRISSKKLSKCFIIPKILKIIPNFDNFFSFVIKIYDSRHFQTALTAKFLTMGTHLTSFFMVRCLLIGVRYAQFIYQGDCSITIFQSCI